MDDNAQLLLMMFIRDAYSASGKIKKATVLKAMKVVHSDPKLNDLVNAGDWGKVLKHRLGETK